MDGEIPQLTTGFLNDIASLPGQDNPVWSSSPIVQFVQTRPIEMGQQGRWRTVISDGAHVMQAMVATQHNPMFENGEVKKGTIIRIARFAINKLQDRRWVVPEISCASRGFLTQPL